MPHYLFCDSDGLVLNCIECPAHDAENQYVSGAEHVIEVAATKVPDFLMNDVTVDLSTGAEINSTPKQFPFDADEAWRYIRKQRDKLLAACDWTQVPDAPVDQAAWAAYRQALRDLPENTTDPANPVWPSKPQ
jgi:hypothetical protein